MHQTWLSFGDVLDKIKNDKTLQLGQRYALQDKTFYFKTNVLLKISQYSQ